MDRYQLALTFSDGDSCEIETEFDHVLDANEVENEARDYIEGWIEEEGGEAAVSAAGITGAAMYELGEDDLATGPAVQSWSLSVSALKNGDDDYDVTCQARAKGDT